MFGVGNYAVSKWIKQSKETGDLSNKPLNYEFKKIAPEKLKAYIAEHPDAYQREIVKVFECSSVTVGKALKRPGITRKKRHCVNVNKEKNR